MADESSEPASEKSLNDRLFALGIFTCTQCSDTLETPIMLHPSLGNVCKKCDRGDRSLRNSALELILKHLSVPCRYASNGCTVKTPYAKQRKHEEICDHRNFPCPLKQTTDCDMQIPLSLVLDHVQEKHPEKLLVAQSNWIETPKLTEENRSAELLVMNSSEPYIVRLELDEQEILGDVYCLASEEEKARNSLFIVRQTDDGHGKASSHQVFPFTKLKEGLDLKQSCVPEYNPDNDLQLKIFSLEKIVQDAIDEVPEDEGEELDEKLLAFFECPVCSFLMRPPIYQCLSGHSVCSNCKPKLTNCATCRAAIENTRNYALEAMCGSIRIPCINRERGCRATFLASTASLHEDQCPLRAYVCPFGGVEECSWEGVHSGICKHLKERHKSKTAFKDSFETWCGGTIVGVDDETICIVTYRQVFKVCVSLSVDDCYWAVQLIGPKEDATKFKYKIALIDEKKSKKLIVDSRCHELTCDDDVFDQCITIPPAVVAWFRDNEDLSYYCKIDKNISTTTTC